MALESSWTRLQHRHTSVLLYIPVPFTWPKNDCWCIKSRDCFERHKWISLVMTAHETQHYHSRNFQLICRCHLRWPVSGMERVRATVTECISMSHADSVACPIWGCWSRRYTMRPCRVSGQNERKHIADEDAPFMGGYYLHYTTVGLSMKKHMSVSTISEVSNILNSVNMVRFCRSKVFQL